MEATVGCNYRMANYCNDYNWRLWMTINAAVNDDSNYNDYNWRLWMTTNAAVNDDSNYNDYNDDRNHNQRNKACGKTRGSCLGRFTPIISLIA